VPELAARLDAGMLSATVSQRVSFRQTSARVLGCILVTACCTAVAQAKGGNPQAYQPNQDGYNPEHINSLPPEIRRSLHANCSEPRALHDFAKYGDSLRTITLHFEHFFCGASHARCSASGCLHEVFSLTGSGRYQLTRRYYAKEHSP
jgi:hypothetical protein